MKLAGLWVLKTLVVFGIKWLRKSDRGVTTDVANTIIDAVVESKANPVSFADVVNIKNLLK